MELTKTTPTGQVKQYFLGLLELRKRKEEYPVDLDDVWPLCYSRKDNAIRDLKTNFLQNIDYQSLLKNAEQKSTGSGGHNKVTYKLSLSCLEYFIVRKVRPVFEVYRQIFHKTAEQYEQAEATNMSIESLVANPDLVIQLATKYKNQLEENKRIERLNRSLNKECDILEEENLLVHASIEGLVKQIPVADMRQRINQIVVKAGHGDVRGAWNLLYREFELKFHINIARRSDWNEFDGSRIDYIDQKLHMIPDLYDLCCKLFLQESEQLKSEFASYNACDPIPKPKPCRKFGRKIVK